MEEERALSLAQPNLVTFDIPAELLVQFKQDVRIVIKWPGLIGIPHSRPVPERRRFQTDRSGVRADALTQAGPSLTG